MAPALLRALSRLGSRPRRAEAGDDRLDARGPAARSSVHVMQTVPADPTSYPRRLLHQFLGHRAAVSQPTLKPAAHEHQGRAVPSADDLLRAAGGPPPSPLRRRASSLLPSSPPRSPEALASASAPARLQTPRSAPALDTRTQSALDTHAPPAPDTLVSSGAGTPEQATTPLSTGSAQPSGTYTAPGSSNDSGAECPPQSTRTLAEGSTGMDTAERGTKQTKDVSRRDTAAGEWGVEEAAGTGLPTDGAQVSLLQDVSERCSAHPGSRNEMWCETCAAAICEHCMLSTAHQGHAVAKLSAAYDDAFEAIEAMQVALVRSRNEARQRGTLLDAARAGLSESCAAAQDALESELERRAEALADAFARTQATLDARMGGCTEWRGVLGETLQTVHGLVDELPPAQLVASRARILALLGASEKARPADWWAPLPRVDGLATLVQPEARSATLRVPRVMELGRKRGHVRVVGRPLAAHGLTWHAEARRGSGPLGDPCLLVAVSCAEGCADAAIAASVHVVAPDEATGRAAVASALDLLRPPGAHEPDPQPQRRLFWQETRTHVWARQAPCELLVCSLAELESAGALDSDGAVTLRFGVQPASFRDLARAQQDRIAALERQLDELQLRQRPPASPADGAPSARPPRARRRGNSDVRGCATSPRIQQRAAGFARGRPATPSAASAAQSPGLPQMPPLPPPPPPPHLALPLLGLALSAPDVATAQASPSRGRANSTVSPPQPPRSPSLDSRPPGSSGMRRHRRALSLTSKLRRQPPIPFPLGPARASSVQLQPAGSSSAISTTSSQTDASRSLGTDASRQTGVLRRLSGWVRSTEGRVAQQARRVRQQLAPAAAAGRDTGSDDHGRLSGDDGICDWTLLDRSLSPGFAANGPQPAARQPPCPQTSPCPVRAAQPFAVARTDTHSSRGSAEELATGGGEDAGREQPAPSEAQTSEAGLRARCDSIQRRVDVLELITNTVENSRDGLSESTLRRIGSELGVLRDGRMRCIAEARAHMATQPPHGRDAGMGLGGDEPPSPPAEGRRSVSMDSAEIRRALSNAGVESEPSPTPPLLMRIAPAKHRRPSGASASSASSSLRAGSTAMRLVGARAPLPSRVLDACPGSLASSGRTGGTADQPEQLTPQATRRGGILKAGRTVRVVPASARNSVTMAENPLGSVESARGLGELLLSSRESVRRRAPRPAKPARKRVRFPEEQRLLETIRLIDPRAAQSIESRVEKCTEPPPAASPPRSPDVFTTASSRFFGSAAGPRASSAPFVRPPLPPQCVGDLDAQAAIADEQRMVRCKGAMIFNRAVLSPTLAAMAQSCSRYPCAPDESSEESDGGSSAAYVDAVCDFRELLPRDDDLAALRGLRVPVAQRPRASSVLAVGPNIASAQSSPSPTPHAQGPASSYSSSPSPPAADSALLCPPETAVFGGPR